MYSKLGAGGWVKNVAKVAKGLLVDSILMKRNRCINASDTVTRVINATHVSAAETGFRALLPYPYIQSIIYYESDGGLTPLEPAGVLSTG